MSFEIDPNAGLLKRTWIKLLLWIHNIFYAIDVLCNAILLGDPRETMSSRMGKDIKENKCGLCKGICWVLSRFWPDHCIHNTITTQTVGDLEILK